MRHTQRGPRRDISASQRADALRRVILEKEPMNQVSRDLGVHRNTIRNWMEALLQDAFPALEDRDNDSDGRSDAELRVRIEQQEACIVYLISELSKQKKRTKACTISQRGHLDVRNRNELVSLVETLAERFSISRQTAIDALGIPRSTYFYWKDQLSEKATRTEEDEKPDRPIDPDWVMGDVYDYAESILVTGSIIGLDRLFYILQDCGISMNITRRIRDYPPIDKPALEAWRSEWMSDFAVFNGNKYSAKDSRWFVVTDSDSSLFRRGSTFTGIVDAHSRFIISWHIGSNLNRKENRASLIQRTEKHYGPKARPIVASPEIDFKTLTMYDLTLEFLRWNGFDPIHLFVSGDPIQDTSRLPSHVSVDDGATYNELWTVIQYLDVYHDWVYVSAEMPFSPRAIYHDSVASVAAARAQAGKINHAPHELWTSTPLRLPEEDAIPFRFRKRFKQYLLSFDE
jgi:transposase-like protein